MISLRFLLIIPYIEINFHRNVTQKLMQCCTSKFSGKIEEVESIWKVMWSKTLRWFYLVPLGIVIVVFISEHWSVLCTIIPICTCK